MSLDASLLVLAVLVFIVQVMVQGLFSNLEHKPKELLGPRDQLSDGKLAARAKRANQNMMEALFMFAPLMLVAIAADRTNEMTALGGWLFVIGRAVYAPLYWFGVPVLRTLAWVAALAGIVLVLLQVLPFTGAA